MTLELVKNDIEETNITEVLFETVEHKFNYTKFLEYMDVAHFKNQGHLNYAYNHNVKLKMPVELWIILLSKDGLLLEYVPTKDLTEIMCYIAINQNGHAYEYLPNMFKTEKLTKRALMSRVDISPYIPKELITTPIAKILLNIGGSAYKHIPYNIMQEINNKAEHDRNTWDLY